MNLFKQILNKVSQYDGTKAPNVILITRTVTDAGNPGSGDRPTYSEVETNLNAYIEPYVERTFVFTTAQALDADFRMITDTDITNFEMHFIKYNDVVYSILEKDSPKLMLYQNAYMYLLKRRVGQF